MVIKVKSHKRKGKVVRSHTRKGRMSLLSRPKRKLSSSDIHERINIKDENPARRGTGNKSLRRAGVNVQDTKLPQFSKTINTAILITSDSVNKKLANKKRLNKLISRK